jgi:hypothetical protein
VLLFLVSRSHDAVTLYTVIKSKVLADFLDAPPTSA